jgi:hypothetical protein
VFQQSNLTQLYEDEYEDIQQLDDFVASSLIQRAGLTTMKNLRKIWMTTLHWFDLKSIDGSHKISDLIK